MRRVLIPLVVAAAAVLPLPPASAGAAAEPIRVKVLSPATLAPGGGINVSIDVWCRPVGGPFERNVTVTQDDGFVWTQRGLPDVPCDRRWHRITVVATPFEGAFHAGTAYVSAYVSRLDPATGQTWQGQDARTVRVR